MSEISREGIRYELQGRDDTKKEAQEGAEVWKDRGYKTIVEKASFPYTGYFVWVESQ